MVASSAMLLFHLFQTKRGEKQRRHMCKVVCSCVRGCASMWMCCCVLLNVYLFFSLLRKQTHISRLKTGVDIRRVSWLSPFSSANFTYFYLNWRMTLTEYECVCVCVCDTFIVFTWLTWLIWYTILWCPRSSCFVFWSSQRRCSE